MLAKGGPRQRKSKNRGTTAGQDFIVHHRHHTPRPPGLATGKVRRIRGSEDLGRFAAGEVLVCDAIQPMMTHLVPLARAVVERRGGMLIHGAIIARELRIPCVNGIAGVADLLQDGDLVTMDGYLGIVTVGPPDFDLELADRK